MIDVKISSDDTSIIIDFLDMESNNYPYSYLLFNQFAVSSSINILKNVENDSTRFRFDAGPDNERRILELLESLKDQNQDISIRHDANISKSIRVFKRSQEDFKLFSEDALRIRNNIQHKFDELNGFEESISHLNQALFWHQSLSAYHMAFSRNSCNFSVPGAGKTRVVYAAYNYLKFIGEVEKIIIVGPLSSAIAWQEEFVSIFGRKPSMLRIGGHTSIEGIDTLYGNNSPEVIHISFQSLPLHTSHIKYLTTKYKTMMVVDEAHRIKNPDGYWSSSLLSLVEDIETAPVARIILTGTPAPNSYVDLHNLFKFIWPKNNIIEYNVAVLKQLSKKSESISSKKKIKKLIASIAPYYIRIRKSDLGLPDITIRDPIVALPDSLHIEIYDYIQNDLIREMKMRGDSTSYGLRTIRLRQAASNPALLMRPVDPNEYNYIVTNESEDYLDAIRHKIIEYNRDYISMKFTKCLELVKSITEQGKKVLIWCEFIGSVNQLSRILEDANIKSALLTGQVSDFDERKAIIDDFNSPAGTNQVIIATTAAVGESISLHYDCHDAVYFEVSYNAGQHLQSMDRIHRLGLPEATETNYWYIQSDFPLERHILKRLREKETAMRKIIDSKDIPLIEDYRKLFFNPYEYVDLRKLIKTDDE